MILNTQFSLPKMQIMQERFNLSKLIYRTRLKNDKGKICNNKKTHIDNFPDAVLIAHLPGVGRVADVLERFCAVSACLF